MMEINKLNIMNEILKIYKKKEDIKMMNFGIL